MRPCPAEVLKLLLRALNGGGIGSLGNGSDIIGYHIRDLIGVGHNHLKRLAQIFKLRKHFIGSPEIQRRLIVRVLVALPRLKNGAENTVLLILEMNVAGSHNGLSQLVGKFYNFTVKLAQTLIVGHPVFTHKERVIGNGLYFKVVVGFGYFFNIAFGLIIKNSPEQFSCLAGAAYYQTFAVFGKLRKRYARFLVKIFEVGKRDQLIEVLQPDLILNQNYHMIGRKLFHVHAAENAVKVAQLFKLSELGGILYKLLKYFSQHLRVVNGAMMVEVPELVFFCHGIQLMVFKMRKRRPAQSERVDIAEGVIQSLPLADSSYERGVKIRAQQARPCPQI